MNFDDRWSGIYAAPQMPPQAAAPQMAPPAMAGNNPYSPMGALGGFNPYSMPSPLPQDYRHSMPIITGSPQAMSSPMSAAFPDAPASVAGLLSAPAQAPAANWPAAPAAPADFKGMGSFGAELFKQGLPKERKPIQQLQAAPPHVPQGIPMPVLYQLLMQKGVS